MHKGGLGVTQEEKRIYLIEYLLSENSVYADVVVPSAEAEQKDLLRALFNVRQANPISDEFLSVQDEYLKAEIENRGVVDVDRLPATKYNEKICLWQGDITTLKADAIVNAANSAMLGCFQPVHSCIDNIIHTLSGVQLRLACSALMKEQGCEEKTGGAKITPGYNLPAKYVLHTVGPIISGRLKQKDKELLADCYRSCLEVALKNNIKSIVFCCISTGVFSFPQKEAAEIAVKTVSEFLKTNDAIEKVVFNVFTDKDLEIYRRLLES